MWSHQAFQRSWTGERLPQTVFHMCSSRGQHLTMTRLTFAMHVSNKRCNRVDKPRDA